jgi:hypothetical protein
MGEYPERRFIIDNLRLRRSCRKQCPERRLLQKMKEIDHEDNTFTER